jgi:CheY-like chemotaxis protein
MAKTVLIADDDDDVVELLTHRCRGLGLEVDSANNAMTALGKAEENPPDLAIIDVDMPYGNGLGVCEMMATHEQLCSIPVVVLTGNTNEGTVRRCHQLCAYYIPKCPDVWTRLEPLVRELLKLDETKDAASSVAVDVPVNKQAKATVPRGPTDLMDTVFAVLGVEEGGNLLEEEAEEPLQRSDQPWVLSIEDDDDFALGIRLRLQELGLQVIRAGAGREGYRRAFLDAPRAIILDYELPEGNGDYVLRRLKESPATCDIPVIVLTGRREASIERQMRGLGAAEFLTKPFDWRRLRRVLQDTLVAST